MATITTGLGDKKAITVDADPTVTAVDAKAGSLIIYNGIWYCKLKDGSNTNVVRIGGPAKGSISGFEMSFNTVAKVDIAAGEASDSTNIYDIVSSATLTADISGTGAGGLQTGSTEAADTWYKVLAIGDTTGTNATKALLVPRGTAFSETGYDVFRHLGCVRNNDSSDFLKFVQHGTGRTRKVFYDEGRTKVRPLLDGTAATFTDVDLSSFVPSTSKFVFLLASFETGGSGLAGDNAELRIDGATSANPIFQIGIGVVSDKKCRVQVSMPCSSSQIIEYAVKDAANNKLTLIVAGYEDQL